MKDEVVGRLKELSGKSHVRVTERGNAAIVQALRYANRKLVYIQDQGGWITYRQYPKKLGYETIELRTDFGIVEDIAPEPDSALLINTLPGYFCEQPMDDIVRVCKDANCLIINDVSGSIGRGVARVGDLIVGSFGKWKPVNLEHGGFIASDNPLPGEDAQIDYPRLRELLKNLDARLKNLQKISDIIKKDLCIHRIIHAENNGINVIVQFGSDAEKNSIVSYCEKNKYEYTICPRYIRVNTDAVSIEVKRWEKPGSL
ncbi:MAG: hypothetical protein ABH879_05600 [archaeon]